MGCCKIETCTTNFGIFIAVLSALTTSAAFMWLAYVIICLLTGTFPNAYDYYEVMYFSVAVVNFAAVSFIFSILLIVGVRKKNFQLMKAYLIYGFIVMILLMAGVIFSFYWITVIDPITLFTIAAVCSFHTMMLVFAYRTYLKMKSRTVRGEHFPSTFNQLLVMEDK